MIITERFVGELIPYGNNPRVNDSSVDAVAASIQEFGFQQPIVVDKDDIVIVGHTRLKAAKKLGLKTVPVVRAENLTDEQVKAYRLADNKTNELAEWDSTLLAQEIGEIPEIDMSVFGFQGREHEWFSSGDSGLSENDSEEYKEFVEKFEAKHTSDDCYTPALVYDAVAEWVAKEYGVDRKNFVRPFRPGGDYQAEQYLPTDIVVDNPPFSIEAEIVKWYTERGIKFFLFCSALTPTYVKNCDYAIVSTMTNIIYANGAKINTSFLTNLEEQGTVIRSAPVLYKKIAEAVREVTKEINKQMPRYEYPKEVLTCAMVGPYSKHGIDFRVKADECMMIRELDAQKQVGKGIFGVGFLLSEKAAAEKAAAEKAAAEKAAAEKAAAEKAAATVWMLSERERDLIKQLSSEG